MPEQINGIKGKILFIGPSRSGKSFLARIFREKGLPVVDADKETNLISWRNDIDNSEVLDIPQIPTEKWLQSHHFLMDKNLLENFLFKNPNVILFAHCWNIMKVLDFFDEIYFMYVPPAELARRMTLPREDHLWQGSKAEVDFMLERHHDGQNKSKELSIPLIDVSQDPEDVIKEFLKLHKDKSLNR